MSVDYQSQAWIIRKPVVTEKSMSLLGSRNVVTFEVDRKATKPMIKKAIERVFQVRVKCVRTLNILGKTKRFKFGYGKHSDVKRALVELYPGEKISIFDQGAQV